MRHLRTHLRSLRFAVNAGINFPECRAHDKTLNMDAATWPMVAQKDSAAVTCKACRRILDGTRSAMVEMGISTRYTPAWCAYVRNIRNPAKRAYAQAYARFKTGEGLDHEPDPGILSVMGAQAVRMNWDEKGSGQ